MLKNTSKLCGGTFFTLFLRCRIKAKSPSQGDCFNALMKIYDPSYIPVIGQNAQTIPSRFKTCDPLLKSEYIRLGDPILSRSFSTRFDSDYFSLLKELRDFMEGKFYTDDTGDWLISALLELIEEDIEISDDTLFFISPNHRGSTKEELKTKPNHYFFCFLLGIWHYICTTPMKPDAGRYTYLSWTNKAKKGIERPFISEIGTTKYQDIIVDYNISEPTTAPSNIEKEYVNDHENIDINHEEKTELTGFEEHGIHIYLENAKAKHSRKETFLYKTARDFYDFFVCSNLKSLDILNESIEDVTIKRIYGISRYIHLLGTGGVGKTMMMNHLFLDSIETYGVTKVPIFITLRNFDQLKHSLADFILSEFKRHDRTLTSSDLDYLMEHGRTLLLMDGLDEVKSSQMTEFNRQFDMLLDQFPKVTCIVSSRPGARIPVLSRFYDLVVKPFSLKQAEEMIIKLDPVLVNEEIKTDFIRDLKNDAFSLSKDEENDFIGNPLFLTIMLTTYKYYHNIPTRRYLFFEHAYEAMAETFDSTTKSLYREYKTGLDSRELKKLLSAFCALTHNDEQYSFSSEELKSYSEKTIRQYGYHFTTNDFLADVIDHLCMMYLDGNRYYFIHRSFQEYFTAYFFSIQLEDSFEFIYNTFKAKDFISYEDQTLDMLYGMDEKKTIRFIIIPFLREIIGTGDTTAYRNFLCKIYSKCQFITGNITISSETWPASKLFVFICTIYDFNYIFSLDGYDISDSIDTIIDVFWGHGNNWHKYNLLNDNRPLSDIIIDIKKRKGKHDTIEYMCCFDFESFYKNNTHLIRSDITEIIESEHFEILKTFNNCKRLLRSLEDKYLNKTPKTDFFSNFK